MLWDAEGNEYIDVMSNYGVNIVGHSHPAVTQAIQQQAGLLLNVHQSFSSDVRAEFLEALMAIAPDGLTQAWLSNSGAEAVEAALKFAHAVTGRPNLVAMQRAYHGRTVAAGQATAPKPGDDSQPGSVTHVPFDDLDALDGAVDDQTAAIIVEPIQGEAGVYPASEGYLAAAAEIAQREGALLIFDEVQTAFRTGDWFVANSEDIVPDILCMAKALANGVPIGATLITAEVSEALPNGLHGSTFGGNPLACAAGLATIQVIKDEDLLAKSVALGDRLRTGIEGLDSDQIREIRGRGQMTGIDLRGRVTPVLRAMQSRGILALPAGNLTLRMLPPLVITEAQIDHVVETLGASLETASRRRRRR
jgi:acetylornithine/LysW-gamma-L-lysine aminotransferase